MLYTQGIFFEILLNEPEIGLYSPLLDWFRTANRRPFGSKSIKCTVKSNYIKFRLVFRQFLNMRMFKNSLRPLSCFCAMFKFQKDEFGKQIISRISDQSLSFSQNLSRFIFDCGIRYLDLFFHLKWNILTYFFNFEIGYFHLFFYLEIG